MLAFCLFETFEAETSEALAQTLKPRLGTTDAARTRAQNEIAPFTPAVEDA